VTTLDDETIVEHVLADYGGRTRDAVLAALPAGQPAGWLYDLMREYPSRPAKFLRPAICLATCRAFGGDPDHVLGPAVAIELLHNTFLIHDDIADESLLRRGEPTLVAQHGVGLALNAGDALAVVAQQVLRRSLDRYGAGLAERVTSEFETMMLRTVEGQATELGWCRDVVVDLTPEDYLDLIMHKTCWYTTIHPLRVGALVGTNGAMDPGGGDLSAMVRFGFYLGAAFQIRDDVLNLVGDEGEYGKEILGDLHEGKRTLMLIHLLGAAQGNDRELVRRYLRCTRPERSTEMVAEVRGMMDRYGSLAFALDYAAGIGAAAHDAFELAFARAEPNEGHAFIRALIPFMLDRNS
jgi:geranylgeranyl diphosphate synthase type II